jgi:hypothetical protein
MASYKVSTDITKDRVTRTYRQYTTDYNSNNHNLLILIIIIISCLNLSG